ncbi:ribosomal-protein-alanine N-acetyltransferase [Nesterenkonia halotolerans]|uniref:Ribosomal-protein-alanine N-acetyltransferase n=2 Tax=Nesterenkonia halotolerans TaxID=225325 RepID=A0ABR9J9D0_9MICC|nr:ribosomal-protein-alanine N-acetyltransferase [Nesterenkonia halotolerans]
MSETSTTKDFTLAPMTALDVTEVLALENRLFPHDAWPESFFYDELAHTGGGDDARAGDAADPSGDAEDDPAGDPGVGTRRYWTARTADGALAGYAGMMCVLPLADVQTLAVAPEMQGHGLGTRLLGLIVEAARTRGAEQVLLEVRADNPGAQALYRREGFEPIHTRPRYYPDGQDALIMRRPLTDLDARSSATDLRSPLS